MASMEPPIRFGVMILITVFVTVANGDGLFLEWHVSTDSSIKPVSTDQPVITINGMFPGPLINATTNDMIYLKVSNYLDDPLLFTWNGIQQRLDSWQDGVSGTNCPIPPGTNWTYAFQVKDQIGTFSYFPSINFLKAGGGFGPIRVNNRPVIQVPFAKPEAEFDLLIGDWFQTNYEDVRSNQNATPDWMLINGKPPYLNNLSLPYESFNVTKGKTYLLRISNVGTTWSFNFRIQNHKMVVVETEGSYVNEIELDSLDVHVGQSYSVLVTANQIVSDYYIVASPKLHKNNNNASDITNLVGIAVLHYDNSTTSANGFLPSGPDPFDLHFSINQARSIRWNLTAGAARPNPQGTFNVTNVTISQTFILKASTSDINGTLFYTVNNVSYLSPDTPLKLADHFSNGTGVYDLDEYPTNSSNDKAVRGVFVASGLHKRWLEAVFENELNKTIDTWHLDGYNFFVVGFGEGKWKPELRSRYNLYDPVSRSTVQVFPRGWSAVYAYLDNPGMWNLRSQKLRNWYLGQELYVRVYDPDPNPNKEDPPPQNLLLCGKYQPAAPSPSPAGPPTPSSSNSRTCSTTHIAWLLVATITALLHLYWSAT
ncbi:hypothetical protein K1719_004302 [Acacia pycnantha]|nr:hypothetical protein K1719_004302 [Acacia pycnantha]